MTELCCLWVLEAVSQRQVCGGLDSPAGWGERVCLGRSPWFVASCLLPVALPCLPSLHISCLHLSFLKGASHIAVRLTPEVLTLTEYFCKGSVSIDRHLLGNVEVRTWPLRFLENTIHPVTRGNTIAVLTTPVLLKQAVKARSQEASEVPWGSYPWGNFWEKL